MDNLIYGESYKDRLARLARGRKYAKSRVTCKAPRGWEPWQPWEDSAIANLVESYGDRDIARLAKIMQRTENAILCRIEKKYGEAMRDKFAAPYRPQFNTFLPENSMPYEPSDAKIHWDAFADIQCAKTHPFFDPTRFAYRVTQREFRAIGRHMAHNGWVPHGVGFPIAISILGCEVLPVMAEVAPILKDYGSSG